MTELTEYIIIVRVLLCVSCVPASCVHIWFVSCPCFMSLWVKYVPAVCMWLCVNYPVYLVPVFWVWFRLVYLWLPGVSCLSALPCLVNIKDYYLSLSHRLCVPVSSLVCAPWQLLNILYNEFIIIILNHLVIPIKLSTQILWVVWIQFKFANSHSLVIGNSHNFYFLFFYWFDKIKIE